MAAETDNLPTALTPNAFTRAGYSFSGWNSLANGSGTGYSDGSTYPFTASVTLYAQWTPDPSYTVTFNSNGGAGTMAAETDNLPTALTPNVFTRAGYSFSGWNSLANGSGTGYSDGSTYPFTSSATLYAQWAVTSYTVTFNANGGTGAMAAETDNTPTALTPNAFTQTGYSFSGWNTLAGGSGTGYGDGATYPFTSSVTLYAQWTPDASYTVLFNSNGGTGTMASETDNVPTALTPNAFTQTGYSFSGWNSLANGSGTGYSDGATYPFTASVTLYAQWTASTPPPAAPPAPPSTPPSGSPSPPTVTGIVPNSGAAKEGTVITITGSGFSTGGDTTVDFGTTAAAAVNCSSTTSCTAASPVEPAGTVDVIVGTSGGTSATSAVDQFTYVPIPTVTRVTPASGPAKGGTKVSVTGHNFVGTVSVHFGGKPGTVVRVLSPSEITVTAPSGSGTVSVTVSTVGGTSNPTAGARFKFVLPPTVSKVTPTTGATQGGTKVMIRGTNFVGTVSVHFGGKLATAVRVVSSSEITVTAPPGAGTVYVTVSAMGGSSKPSDSEEYRY
jgi:uncharacterized repeat protein (TIGR02543 family)